MPAKPTILEKGGFRLFLHRPGRLPLKIGVRTAGDGEAIFQMKAGKPRALTHRYAEAMREPIDFADEHSAERRGQLMLAVSDLMQMLQRDFLR